MQVWVGVRDLLDEKFRMLTNTSCETIEIGNPGAGIGYRFWIKFATEALA
jgi:hypothetical protein